MLFARIPTPIEKKRTSSSSEHDKLSLFILRHNWELPAAKSFPDSIDKVCDDYISTRNAAAKKAAHFGNIYMFQKCVESGEEIDFIACIRIAILNARVKIIQYILQIFRPTDKCCKHFLYTITKTVDTYSSIRLEIFQCFEKIYEIWPCLRKDLIDTAKKYHNVSLLKYLELKN